MSAIDTVTIFPTTRCDRGCQHCLTNSTMTGDDMTVDTTMEIIEWISRSKTPKSRKSVVGITGGGEPLINRQLPNIIGALVDAKCFSEKIRMVTSGCLPGTDESDMLKEIMDKHGKYVNLSLSFHLFQPSFSQRLEHTLKMALECSAVKQINIKMTVFDNSFAAHELLDNIFERLGVTDVCGTTNKSLLQIGRDRYLQNAISKNESRNGVPPLFATLVDTIHFYQNKMVIVYPQTLSKAGRGARFFTRKETDFCSLFDDPQQRHKVTIPPNGNILPAEDARCFNQKKLYIGNIREHDFKELLRRRKLAHKVLRCMMANPSELPVCQLCHAEMLKQGLVS